MIIDAPPAIHRTYATCYNLPGIMADGTRVRPHSAASNTLPLGTRIHLINRRFNGMRNFIVRDTGSALSDGHIDLWKTGNCSRWGRKRVRFVITRPTTSGAAS